MTLEITLPFGKKNNLKNMVFSILINEYPLKLIELTNIIRKRYGRSVTFQAVRKAVMELVEEQVLMRKEHAFLINKEWILDTKKTIDKLYSEFSQEKKVPREAESISGEISVFTFHSLKEMIQFWQAIIDDWYLKTKHIEHPINCHQAAHVWEVALFPVEEQKVMTQLIKKGVKCYSVTTSNTPLDKHASKFYKSIGIKTAINTTNNSYDRGYYVGTYGETIVETRYPQKLVKQLDEFYKKNTKIEDIDIKQLSDIVGMKIEIKLTVIKNLQMAKQINESIIRQIE